MRKLTNRSIYLLRFILKLFFLLSVFGFFSSIHGQFQTTAGDTLPSSHINGENPLSPEKSSMHLKFNPFPGELFLSLPINREYTQDFHVFTGDFFWENNYPLYDVSETNKPLDLFHLKYEFAESFQIMREGTIKNDLGLFGKILGYTNAAAALGLAVMHFTKYGDKKNPDETKEKKTPEPLERVKE